MTKMKRYLETNKGGPMKPFGEDPMDQFSIPVSRKDTQLGKVFKLNERRNPQKPGRGLLVIHDSRQPLIPDFTPAYSYRVHFDHGYVWAGNHFHKVKTELYFFLFGQFRVELFNPETRKKETLDFHFEENKVLLVRPGIVHKVTALMRDSILLVQASSPNTEDDEFPYEIP